MIDIATLSDREMPEPMPPPGWGALELIGAIQDAAIEHGATAFFSSWWPSWVVGDGSTLPGPVFRVLVRFDGKAYEFARTVATEDAFGAVASACDDEIRRLVAG